jgi:hypothetical protein
MDRTLLWSSLSTATTIRYYWLYIHLIQPILYSLWMSACLNLSQRLTQLNWPTLCMDAKVYRQLQKETSTACLIRPGWPHLRRKLYSRASRRVDYYLLIQRQSLNDLRLKMLNGHPQVIVLLRYLALQTGERLRGFYVR